MNSNINNNSSNNNDSNNELDDINYNNNSNIIKKLEEDVSLKVRSSAVIVSLEQAIEEVVFNSIDAKATVIVISINFSNLTFEVKDNGFGFSYSNLQNVGEHNCTSKISKLSDLKSLSTFGYRGESLASLSDVSYLDIISTSNNIVISKEKLDKANKRFVKDEQESNNNNNSNNSNYNSNSNNITVQKTFNFGKCEQFKIIDTPQQVNNGTIVRVRDLFKNYPVRRQGLFHPNLKLILKKRIEIIALSFPNIRFSVYDETKSLNILKTPKETSFISYFKHFYGQEMANKLEFICSEGSSNERSFYLSGYVSSPQKKGHPNKSFQYFYLNNRIILNTKIHRHINQLYQKFRLFNAERRAHANISKLPKKEIIDSNPIFVLSLKCSQLEYERSYEPSSKTFLEFNDWKKPLTEIQNVLTKFLTRFRDNDTLLYRYNQKRSDTSSVLDISIFEDNNIGSSQIDSEEAEDDGFDLGYKNNSDQQQQQQQQQQDYDYTSGGNDFLDSQNDEEEEDLDIVNNSGFLNSGDIKRKTEEDFINGILPDSFFLTEKTAPSPSKSTSPFKSIISPSKLSFQNISLNNTSPTKFNNSPITHTTTTTTTNTAATANLSSPASSPSHSSQNQSQTSIQLAQQFTSTLQPLSSSSSSSQKSNMSSQSPTSSQNNQSPKLSSSSLKSSSSLPQFNLLNNNGSINERKKEREEFEIKKEEESNKKLKQNDDELNYTDFSLGYSDADSEDTILESSLYNKPTQQPFKNSNYFSSTEREINKSITNPTNPTTTTTTTTTATPISPVANNNNSIELSNSKEIVPYVKREPNLLDEHQLENYNPNFNNDETIIRRDDENNNNNNNNNNKANYSLKVSSYREIIDLENDETTTITTTTTTIQSVKTVTVKKKNNNINTFNQYKIKNEHPLLIKKEDFKELNDNASTYSKSNESNESLFDSSCLDIVPFEVSDDEEDQVENDSSKNNIVNPNLNENTTPPSSPPQASPLKNNIRKQQDFIKQENESPTKKQRIVINLESDEDDYIDTPIKASQLNSALTNIKRENSKNNGIFSKYFKSNFDKEESTENTPILRETKLLNISTETDLPSTESAFSDDEYIKKKVTFDIDRNQFFSPPQFYYDDQDEEELNNNNEELQVKKENDFKIKLEKENNQVKEEEEEDVDIEGDTCPTHHHHNCNHEETIPNYSKIELMKTYTHNNNSISKYFDDKSNPNDEQTQAETNRGAFIKELLSQKSQETIQKERLKDFKFITQWDSKFLVCEANGIVFILDQHAVSERIKLETLEKKYFSENKFDLCPMPERSRWSLTEYELELMKIYTKNLEDWGFKWRFNQTSITILQVPMFCLVGLGVNDLREFLYLLENNKGSPSTRPPAAHRILASKACRTAIKFGHNLSKEVCIKLLRDLNECNIPFQCAHGRPSIIPLINYGKLFNNLNK